MLKVKGILNLLAAASVGAAAGTGAYALVGRIPFVSSIPMVQHLAGFGAAYAVGLKLGKGKNGGWAGVAGYALMTGVLQGLTGAFTNGAQTTTAGALF